MNESQTRHDKIDPKLVLAGWGKVQDSYVLTEVPISKGRISSSVKQSSLKADYILRYKGVKLAVVEAKSDEKDVSEGVMQAKLYADKLKIRFTYATNGDKIYCIDIESGEEGEIEKFPSPEELWEWTFGEADKWRDKFNEQPFYSDGTRQPRYYQEIAVNRALAAIAKGEKRILLTLATGTGKTFIASQIAYKLFHTKWNIKGTENRPRILFLVDRNILANQAFNDFGDAFKADALKRIKPNEIRKDGRVPTNGSVFFTIFQTFLSSDGETAFFGQYPADFFDFIIIDECHRGGAKDESNWRKILEYFEPAVQLGLTATPKRDVNADTYRYFSMESYSATTSTTIDGEKIDLGTTTPTYDYAGDAETIEIVIGDGSYWRYVKAVYPAIKESSAGKVYTNEAASVVWKFNSGADYESNVKTPEDGFTAAEVNIGDLTITGTATRTADDLAAGITFIKFKPAGTTKAVEWSVKPSKGLTFTPTKVSMWIQRFGTDAENGVVVTAKLADGTTENLGTFTAPRANQDASKDKYAGNANWKNQVVIELTAEQQAMLTSAESFTISATVGVGNSKEGGFSDVHIEGLLNGTIADVAKYTLAANVVPEGAGTITAKPKAAEYEEGTDITLTATKNFGYKFVNWTDGEGNVVAEENVYKFAIAENTVLNANFEAVNTYALNYGVDTESGAKLYMVTPTPAPTVVDGKNMYEDGTKVTLTAASNPILTFTNWSDGQTSGEITIDMTNDVDIIANYTPADYIVGWDFILPGNNGRVADFAAADNDADQLVLRDAEGTTYGWLDKSWQGQGGYEGRPAGVNWTTIELGKTYWQTKINAAAFTDITLQTAMVYNYNAYKTYLVEYSLDNENWALAGKIEMPGVKAWTDLTVTLPEECNNKEAVYVRWIADKTSAIDGTTSNNDGATIGATYFTGTPKFVNDGVAPVLVSSVPENGATNASANGKIVLTFDEKVKLTAAAQATLDGTVLTGAATGKTATFEYKGLAYSTDYTFTLKAGSVADLGDNAVAEDIVINFTTKNKPEVAKALYDFVVPTDGNFREAIEAANARADKSARYRIFVLAGDHKVPTKGERAGTNTFENQMYPDPRLDLTVNNVSIIGEGLEETTITNICPATVDGVNPIEGLRNAYTLHNSGSYTYIQDLKLVNGMADNTGRGEAYEESGDKTILKNVGLWGYQDTYCSNNGRGRYYFEGGVVRGRTDYICGKDDIFFNGVTFQNCAAGYIAVPSNPYKYGWILKDCVIKSEPGKEAECDGKYTLGRPWGKGTPIALWIDTKMESQPSAIGWSEMSGGWPARFAEYNSMTATGTVIDLSGRKNIYADTHENNPVLTKEEADFYTIARVMGGDDDWDPTAATEQASAPTNVVLDGTTITWDNSNYALLWAVCKDGKVVDFTIEPTYTVDDAAATWSVRAANEMGGLGEATVAEIANAISEAAAENGNAVSTQYYNLQGARVSKSYNGVVIKVETMENGKKVATKIAK